MELDEIVYRAILDAIREGLEEIDLDGAIRDVARAIIEERAEDIAAKSLRIGRS